ncbi:unnamed protein product [Ilex paraguariensis]|uniref:Uncharacterized protein n=1 Tax=Ilex paraguariensis TaxID=185542 RepID=A0ABC8TD64_9AQUA
MDDIYDVVRLLGRGKGVSLFWPGLYVFFQVSVSDQSFQERFVYPAAFGAMSEIPVIGTPNLLITGGGIALHPGRPLEERLMLDFMEQLEDGFLEHSVNSFGRPPWRG